MINRKIMPISIFLLIIFIFTFVFFSFIHPLIVFDSDDWRYIVENRLAIPIPVAWNPTRILPETLMPLFSHIGVIIFMPLTNNYLFSLTLIHSVVFSIFVVSYLYCFIKLLKDKFKLNNSITIFISLLFFLLHFLIFRTSISNNNYMFRAPDLSCYYFYLIPALLNLSLIMYFIADNTFNKNNSFGKISILILLCYLATFSNLFQSIILATYIFSNLLFKYLNTKNKKISDFLESNIGQCIILIGWLLSQIMEMQGGRANSIHSNESFINKFFISVKNLFDVFKSFNIIFIFLLVGAALYLTIISIKKKYYRNKNFKILSLSFLLTTLYIILLCSACGPEYILRPDAIFGILFYLVFIVCIAVAFLSVRYKFIVVLFPIFLYIIYFSINTTGKTFIEPTYNIFSYEQMINVDNIIINQIIEASNDRNKTDVTIYIPKFDDDVNWPFTRIGTNRIYKALIKHGLIRNNINLNINVEIDCYLDEYIEKYNKYLQ